MSAQTVGLHAALIGGVLGRLYDRDGKVEGRLAGPPWRIAFVRGVDEERGAYTMVVAQSLTKLAKRTGREFELAAWLAYDASGPAFPPSRVRHGQAELIAWAFGGAAS